jgi:hypothetical protein
MNFEGQSITLAGLKSWVCWTYAQEIERKVNEKLESLAVGAVEVGEYLWKKIGHKANSPVVGDQS